MALIREGRLFDSRRLFDRYATAKIVAFPRGAIIPNGAFIRIITAQVNIIRYHGDANALLEAIP